MAVDFNIQNIITLISDSFFGGNTTLTGLALMMASFTILLVIMSRIGAHPVYAVIPMIPTALFFMAMGVMSTDVSLLLVIITVVVVGTYGKKIVSEREGGGE